jgi:hypothetical protein
MVGGFGGGLAGGAVVAIVIKATDQFSKTFKDAEGGMKRISKGALVAGGAITAFGIAGATALVGFAKQAAVAGDVQAVFNTLVGEKGPEALKEFQKATLGTISKTKSMAVINAAVNKGIEAENVPVLANYVQQLSDAGAIQGDVSRTMDTLTTSIASGTTITLKRLGIMIDAKSAQEEYAASIGKTVAELTEEERSLAFTTKAMELIKKKSEELPEPTKDFADQLAATQATMTDLKETIGNEVLPILEPLLGFIQNMIDKFVNLDDKTKKIIIIAGIVAVVLALVIGPILILIAVLPALAAGFAMVSASLGPILIIIIAIIAVIVIIIVVWKNWDKIVAFSMKVWKAAGESFKMIWTKVKDFFVGLTKGIANLFINMWNFIISAAEVALNLYVKFINGVIKAANKVPKVNIPLIPKIDLSAIKIPLLAKGGIVTEPTLAVVGEKGPEAVIPLGQKMPGMTVINIENIFGTDPEEISRALLVELNTKRSI